MFTNIKESDKKNGQSLAIVAGFDSLLDSIYNDLSFDVSHDQTVIIVTIVIISSDDHCDF